MVNEIPSANKVPPEEALYQRNVFPFVPAAPVKVTIDGPHRVAFATVGKEGIGFIKILIRMRKLSHPVIVSMLDTK